MCDSIVLQRNLMCKLFCVEKSCMISGWGREMVWVVLDVTLGTSETMPEKRLLPKIGGKNNNNFRLVQVFH